MTSDYSLLMKPWYEQMEAQKPPAQTASNRLSEAEELEVAEAHERATNSLHLALVGRILAQSPEFFEELIIDVMLAMGYAQGGAIWREGWGGKAMAGLTGLWSRMNWASTSSICRPSATSWGRRFRSPTSGTLPEPWTRIMPARACLLPPASLPKRRGILFRCCRGASC